MIRALKSVTRLFRRSENGSATVEFAITVPAMLLLMCSGVELGFTSIRHAALERAVDLTVRDIRLGTGTFPQDSEVAHNQIKQAICDRVGFIDNCNDNLKLEMILVDTRAWVAPNPDADCTDQSQDAEPPRGFTNGMDNDLMLLRACAKFDPVFPTSGLGKNIAKDDAGQYQLIATSAFVQEPR